MEYLLEELNVVRDTWSSYLDTPADRAYLTRGRRVVCPRCGDPMAMGKKFDMINIQEWGGDAGNNLTVQDQLGSFRVTLAIGPKAVG